MNISQEIRNTLARSGEPMTIAQITDAIGGLADAKFVQAICSQHTKKGAFDRKMEDGQLVYWMVDQSKAANEAGEETPAPSSVATDRATAATRATPTPRTTRPAKAECAKRTTSAPSERQLEATHPFIPDETAKDLAAVIDLPAPDLVDLVKNHAHSMTRLLTNLLCDAIDAQLEHEALRRICTAQQAVQDVYAYLVAQA